MPIWACKRVQQELFLHARMHIFLEIMGQHAQRFFMNMGIAKVPNRVEKGHYDYFTTKGDTTPENLS